MIDIVGPEFRSELMSRIRSTDTKPEMAVRRMLFGAGYRYQIHCKDLPGKPDLVFRSRKKVIFVHGCYWHRHGCSRTYNPKSRTEFWNEKFARNMQRDQKNQEELCGLGWKMLVVWECEVESDDQLKRMSKFLGPTRWVKKT